MHVTTKDAVQDDKQAKELGLPVGSHLLTSVIEGDGAVALCSDTAKLSAKVVSLKRTDSGGIELVMGVSVAEPAPVAAPPAAPVISDEQKCINYYVSKGFNAKTAKDQVDRFGIARVLTQIQKDEDAAFEASLQPPAAK